MTAEQLAQRAWALIAAALADDTAGVELLVDELAVDELRDVLVGLVQVAGAALARHADQGSLLALVRQRLIERSGADSGGAG